MKLHNGIDVEDGITYIEGAHGIGKEISLHATIPKTGVYGLLVELEDEASFMVDKYGVTSDDPFSIDVDRKEVRELALISAAKQRKNRVEMKKLEDTEIVTYR